MPRDYLTVADVLCMHTVLIQDYGGALGVRDPGVLEAALFRPQTGYYEDIVAETAGWMESLAINHPFVDGNKRVARLERRPSPPGAADYHQVHFLKRFFSC